MKFMTAARKYMDETDGAGSDLGGAVDRGDTTEVVVVAPIVADKADKAADAAPVDKPRDESGKFVAKEDAVADAAPAVVAPAAKDKDKMIPKARFDEQVQKERARTESAERRAAELEKQIQQVKHDNNADALETEVKELSVKAEAARLDGNKDEVNALTEQIRLKERQINLAQNSRMTETAKEQIREEMRMDLTIDKLEVEYPMLNEKSEDYDQDMVDLVLATQRDLITRERMAPSKALEAATKKVMGKLAPKPLVVDAADEGEANTGADKGGLNKADGKAADRKAEQIKKNLDTANKQPASMKEVGLDGDKLGQSKDQPAASELTYEEFSALPEATKAKMRGDLVS